MAKTKIKSQADWVDLAEAIKSTAHPKRIAILHLMCRCGFDQTMMKYIYRSLHLEQSIINAQTTLTETVSADENKLTTISEQVKGRIDHLSVRQEGEHIVKGQALYSEELLADQHDYLSALRQRTKFPGQQSTVEKLIQGGLKKLLLWGMKEAQIKNLELNHQASALLS
jgi:Fic family protein